MICTSASTASSPLVRRDAALQVRQHSTVTLTASPVAEMNFRQSLTNINNANLEGSMRIKPQPWLRRSLRSMRRHPSKEMTAADSLLCRGTKQVNPSRSYGFLDYADSNRKCVTLEKQENEVFGFEVQTYGLQQRNRTAVEMCTYVFKVQEESPAQKAGMITGDVIVAVNGVNTEGASHQLIVKLIQESSHVLRMEMVSGTVMKKIELEMKLRSLKQSLREKWAELQELTLQELRFAEANQSECSSYPSIDSPMSLASPVELDSCRLSSVSSCWSMMTEDGEEAGQVTSDFVERNSQKGRRMSIESQVSSSGSLSPSLNLLGVTMLFGTVPRRAKADHVRKRISKLIPGLSNSLEGRENS
ncbi:cytohesin-interacting protein-like [Brienomyrus brachyistius]|uniref:cytohesin-interacting protein-like n=1 Tax=Brienomyrus brachyistius TaxID=42636 RepID=UPI0020B3DC8C|nr:cytohesin-interacting protein-like [Brienomyrus brachyistius]